MNKKKIGFIGLGDMGYPMVNRLSDAGYEIYTAGHSRSKNTLDKLKILKEKGLHIEETFANVAKASDVVITILPADDELKEVLLNENFMKNLNKESMIIDMTSCRADTIQSIGKIYEKEGVKVVDAPVSGGVGGAEKGALAILASGEEEYIKEIQDIFDILGDKTFYIGKLGMGKAMKSVNQMMVSLNIIATAEAYSIARKQGLDPEMVHKVIKKSTGYSNMFDRKFMNIVEKKFDKGFKLKHMRKDLRVAIESGEGVPLPFSKLAHEFYLMAKDYDELDFTSISKLLLD